MSPYPLKFVAPSTHVFLLKNFRVVMLESKLMARNFQATSSDEGHDLYILAGHEASY